MNNCSPINYFRGSHSAIRALSLWHSVCIEMNMMNLLGYKCVPYLGPKESIQRWRNLVTLDRLGKSRWWNYPRVFKRPERKDMQGHWTGYKIGLCPLREYSMENIYPSFLYVCVRLIKEKRSMATDGWKRLGLLPVHQSVAGNNSEL